MPTKRTRRTRQRRPDELKAWRTFFECGFDYFGDLAAIGIHKERDAQKAAPEAWERLSSEFLRTWQPTAARSLPWALTAYGTS